MSRYLIPFVNQSSWQTKNNCNYCRIIDGKYNEIFNMTDNEEKQKTLLFLESLLTDGYGLLNVFERNGYIMSLQNELERIELYSSNNNLFMNKVWNVLYPNKKEILPDDSTIDLPVLIHSRWCNHCGSRKPDIYNSDRQDNLNLLDIDNFYITYDGINAIINWEDVFSANWYGVKLIKTMDAVPIAIGGGITVVDSKIFNQFTNSNPFIDNNFEKGHVYYYRLFAYDVDGKIIKVSKVLDVFVPIIDNVPPNIIDDLALRQVRIIELNNDVYENKDYVLATWTNPINSDWDSTDLKFSDKSVPGTCDNGKIGSNKNLIDLSGKNPDALQLGTTYYFKTFPYDTIKYEINPTGPGYLPYRNYQNNSLMQYITIKSLTNNVTNLQIKIEDTKVKLTWDDPIDNNWKETKVIYKKDSMILDENDGNLFTISNIKNQYSSNELIIDNLQNDELYYFGVFPINNDDLCNVSIENQISGIPEYYVNDKFINFNDDDNFKFTYLGHWKIVDFSEIKVLQSPNLNIDKTDLCYLEITDMKYGGTIKFDYLSNLITNLDHFSVYINNELKFTTTRVNNWKTVELEIPSGNYFNIRFQFDKSKLPNDLTSYVLINKIQICYNSYRKED